MYSILRLVAELGLTQIILQMMVKNTEVETLMGQRADESTSRGVRAGGV